THHRLPAVGLRTKLVLAALALLVIPWAGYSYVKAIERLLRENQQQQLVATARGVATALQDRPGFMGTPADGAAVGARAATDQVQLLIAGLARPGLRIWVVDRKLWLVAVAGDLKGPLPAAPGSPTFGPPQGGGQAAPRPVHESPDQRPGPAA